MIIELILVVKNAGDLLLFRDYLGFQILLGDHWVVDVDIDRGSVTTGVNLSN